MSLTFYLCVYVVLIALAILSPKDRRVNLVLILVLLAVLLVPSWRLDGVDRDVYLGSMDGTSAILVAEASFYHVCRVASFVSLDERFVFLIYAVISVGGTLLILWLVNRRLWWCVLVYYSHFYVLHGMIQVRCANSVLFFLVFVFLWNVCPPGVETRCHFRSKFGALIALAGSVYWHNSGCAGLIALFLRRKWFAPTLCFSLMVVAVVAYASGFKLSPLLNMMHLSFVQDGLDKYNLAMAAGKEMDYHALGMWRLLKLALAIVFLAYSARIIRFSRTSAFLKIWLMGLCIGLVLADYPSLAGRLSEYFESVEYVLLPTAGFAIFGRAGVIPIFFYCICSTYCDILRPGLVPL